MKTEHELALALKTMMAEVPLDEISVTSLTKRCHINRKTFYYHSEFYFCGKITTPLRQKAGQWEIIVPVQSATDEND